MQRTTYLDNLFNTGVTGQWMHVSIDGDVGHRPVQLSRPPWAMSMAELETQGNGHKTVEDPPAQDGLGEANLANPDEAAARAIQNYIVDDAEDFG